MSFCQSWTAAILESAGSGSCPSGETPSAAAAGRPRGKGQAPRRDQCGKQWLAVAVQLESLIQDWGLLSSFGNKNFLYVIGKSLLTFV